MRALSIRQPYAELILRGIKRIEYRSRRTNIVGERFYIYAAGKKWAAGSGPRAVWSRDLGGAEPPPWIVELAEAMELLGPDARLPSGVIVGSAIVDRVEHVDSGSLIVDGRRTLSPSTIHNPPSTFFRWHLRDVERIARPRKPERQPQPVWFRPF